MIYSALRQRLCCYIIPSLWLQAWPKFPLPLLTHPILSSFSSSHFCWGVWIQMESRPYGVTTAYYQPQLHCATRPEGDGERKGETEEEKELMERKKGSLYKMHSWPANIMELRLTLLKKENNTTLWHFDCSVSMRRLTLMGYYKGFFKTAAVSQHTYICAILLLIWNNIFPRPN